MELMEARNTLDVKNQVWFIQFVKSYLNINPCAVINCLFFFFIQEFSVLQINTEGQIKVLETDLQAARATLAALKDRNKDLGKI